MRKNGGTETHLIWKKPWVHSGESVRPWYIKHVTFKIYFFFVFVLQCWLNKHPEAKSSNVNLVLSPVNLSSNILCVWGSGKKDPNMRTWLTKVLKDVYLMKCWSAARSRKQKQVDRKVKSQKYKKHVKQWSEESFKSSLNPLTCHWAVYQILVQQLLLT